MQMRAFACLLQAGMACTGSTCGLALKKPIRRLPLPPGCRDFSEVSIGPVAPSGLDRLGGKEIISLFPTVKLACPVCLRGGQELPFNTWHSKTSPWQARHLTSYVCAVGRAISVAAWVWSTGEVTQSGGQAGLADRQVVLRSSQRTGHCLYVQPTCCTLKLVDAWGTQQQLLQGT